MLQRKFSILPCPTKSACATSTLVACSYKISVGNRAWLFLFTFLGSRLSNRFTQLSKLNFQLGILNSKLSRKSTETNLKL